MSKNKSKITEQRKITVRGKHTERVASPVFHTVLITYVIALSL